MSENVKQAGRQADRPLFGSVGRAENGARDKTGVSFFSFVLSLAPFRFRARCIINGGKSKTAHSLERGKREMPYLDCFTFY